MGQEENELPGIVTAVPVYTIDIQNDPQYSEDLDPLYIQEQVKIGTERGRFLRDIEIGRDQIAQNLALQKQESELKAGISIGQANAYFRNQEGLTVYIDHEREEKEQTKLMQQRLLKPQNDSPSQLKFSNCPGGGYDVATYDIEEYEGMTYDTHYAYKSVYDE